MTLSKEVYTSHFSSRYEPPLRAAHYFEIISWNSQLFLPDFSIWLLPVRILLDNNLLSVNSEKTLWMQCKPCFSASIMTLQERILVWKGGQNYRLVHYYIGNAPLIFITFSNITNKTIFLSKSFISLIHVCLCFITAFSDSKLDRVWSVQKKSRKTVFLTKSRVVLAKSKAPNIWISYPP